MKNLSGESDSEESWYDEDNWEWMNRPRDVVEEYKRRNKRGEDFTYEEWHAHKKDIMRHINNMTDGFFNLVDSKQGCTRCQK